MLLNIFKIIYKSVFVVLKKNLRSIRVKKGFKNKTNI